MRILLLLLHLPLLVAQLTFDPCNSPKDCTPPRKCLSRDLLLTCRPPESCICYPPQVIPCDKCPPGELCAKQQNNPTPFCASSSAIADDPALTPSNPGSGGGQKPDDDGFPSVTDPTPSPSSSSAKEQPSSTPSSSPPEKPSESEPPPTKTPKPSKAPSPSKSVGPKESPEDDPDTPSVQGDGLAGEECGKDKGCLDYRECLHVETNTPCKDRTGCVCMGSKRCECNEDCTDGELCTGDANLKLCFSPLVIDSLPWATDIPCESETEEESLTGLTGDRCRVDRQCREDRRCVAGGGLDCVLEDVLCKADKMKCDTADTVCYCFAEKVCACNDDCTDTEVCAEIPEGRFCISSQVVDESGWVDPIKCTGDDVVDVPAPATAEPDEGGGVVETTKTPEDDDDDDDDEEDGVSAPAEDGICVDAELLGDNRIWQRNIWAWVWCDNNNSCATGGHMVVWNQQSMMMKTYCQQVGCTRETRWVNSPKRIMGSRVESRTPGLQFTPYAARYQTWVEETALKLVVNAGF